MDPRLPILDLLPRLLAQHRRALAAVARREGLPPEEAIDCVQDGLCTLLQLAQRGEIALAESTMTRSLTAIVRNAARNRRRRHRLARPHAPLHAIDLPSPDPGSDALCERAEQRDRVEACVAQLSERQRAVVMLRLLEERDGQDVAAELGLTRTHVDVLLHRAKHCLRACLDC